MTTALQMLKRLERVDVLLSAQAAIEETASDATKAQRDQLNQGLKSDGTYQPDYSPTSVTKFGKPPGPIKLFDTGSFYRGIIVDVLGEKFSIFSIDEKNDFLEVKYSPLGLGVQARIEWVRSLRPVFVKQIKNYLK
jgi:hypothetical protein